MDITKLIWEKVDTEDKLYPTNYYLIDNATYPFTWHIMCFLEKGRRRYELSGSPDGKKIEKVFKNLSEAKDFVKKNITRRLKKVERKMILGLKSKVSELEKENATLKQKIAKQDELKERIAEQDKILHILVCADIAGVDIKKIIEMIMNGATEKECFVIINKAYRQSHRETTLSFGED